jgi:hypothetical protein
MLSASIMLLPFALWLWPAAIVLTGTLLATGFIGSKAAAAREGG